MAEGIDGRRGCARSGVAVSALHFYEARGLIRSHRTAGNQRRYGRDVLRRVARHPGRAGGRHLAGRNRRGTCLAARRPHAEPRGLERALSTAGATELDRRIAQLKKLRDGLTDCIGCGCMSIDKCPLRNPDDRLAEAGAGREATGAVRRRV